MANQRIHADATGLALYQHICNAQGQIYNGSTFETYSAANWSTYTQTLTEQGVSGVYAGAVPAIADGTYTLVTYLRGGASPAVTDIVASEAEVLTAVSGGGGGAYPVTVTVTDGVLPLESALVALYKAPDTFYAYSNSSGVATFSLNAGTYTCNLSHAGYYAAASSVVVTASGNFAKTMAVIAITLPSLPSQSQAYTITVDAHGAIKGGVAVGFTMTAGPGTTTLTYDTTELIVTSDAVTGVLQTPLVRGATYDIRIPVGETVSFPVPNTATCQLPEIIG